MNRLDFRTRRLHKASMFSIILLVLCSSLALADANDGEYLGYRLGEKFSAPKKSTSRDHIMGALIYDLDPGRHRRHIDKISVFVSRTSSIVGSIFGEWYFSDHRAAKAFADGYLSNLESKYGHWKRSGRSLTYGDYQLWVDIEEKSPIVDHWLSPKKARVAIGLIYAPDSLGRREWMALVNKEVNHLELSAGQ